MLPRPSVSSKLGKMPFRVFLQPLTSVFCIIAARDSSVFSPLKYEKRERELAHLIEKLVCGYNRPLADRPANSLARPYPPSEIF
jgi:hypothetical protein